VANLQEKRGHSMTTRQSILLLIGVSLISALVACGGGSGSGTGTTPPAIAVTFQSAPPSSLQVGKTASLTASVQNDSGEAGVNWSCTPASACGSFSPTHTASDSATTYTAPGSAGAVTITATSVTDATKSVSSVITITKGVISVTFNPAPPTSVAVSSMNDITAIVTNDSNGVSWSCTPVNSCGSFSPTKTPSGVPTTYTAPPAVPSGGTVTVKATSVTDSTKSASWAITITNPNGNITVTLNPAPPASVPIGSTNPITAITNDTHGVNWSCTPVSACGSFSPTQTLSGIPTRYTAPNMIPSGGQVTVTATSVTDSLAFASATITITQPQISVAFDPQPPPFLLVNGSTPITALVAFDPQQLGVDWSCAPANSCGSFNPAHTASGVPTSYTAPGSAGPVNITASSTAAPSKTARATIAVATAFGAAALDGNYVFEASGRDTFAHVPPSIYHVAGVLQADGGGNIIGGELLYENQPNNNNNPVDSITGGSYTIGSADGRGTITINTADTGIGVNGVLTFSLAMLSGTNGLITQFDASASSTGTLDLQTPYSLTNLLSGGYAFVTSGVDSATEGRFPLAMGGVFNVDGLGTISGNGTVMDLIDNGTTTTGVGLTTAGSVAPPDQFGKVIINLNPAFPGSPAVTIAGFIVDDTHIKLIERDQILGVTGGVATAQGSKTGKFSGNGAFNTTVVYSTSGFSTVSGNAEQPTVYAGEFTADGSGNLTNGYTDENQFGILTSDTLTGSYTVDSTGTGRVVTSNVFYGSSGPGPAWIFYLTGASDAPALILQVNGTTHNSSNYIETVGTAYTQAAGPPGVSSFSGPYGMGFSYFPASGGEDDGTGQVTADGVGSLTPGTEDANVCVIGVQLCTSFNPMPGLTLSGTFGNSGVSGRFAGTLNDNTVFNFDPIAFYIADSTRILFIDTGSVPALGVFRQQE
jgi:hypothetical protein